MKKILLLFVISSFIFLGCQSQVKPIGEAILDLENFNFNTKISTLYPEKYKSEEYKNTYIMKGFNSNEIFVTIDSTYIWEKNSSLEYLQGNSSSLDSIAIFGNHIFQKVNAMSADDGKIKIINGVSYWTSKTSADNFLKLLNEKYGKPTKLINGWKNELILYQWEANNRVIRFVSNPNNDIDDFNKQYKLINENFKPTKQEPQFDCYLFIINSAYKEEVFEQTNFSGDFGFFSNEK